MVCAEPILDYVFYHHWGVAWQIQHGLAWLKTRPGLGAGQSYRPAQHSHKQVVPAPQRGQHKQPGPVASPLAGSLQKCLCEPGSNSSIRRESGSGHYMLLRTLKEKEAGCWGHAAIHHFLWDVGLKPYPLSQSWSLALPLKCWPQGNSQQPEHSPARQSHTCRPPGLLIGFGQCRAGKTWPE